MTESYIFTPKNAEKYFCEMCDFKCCKGSDWDRHLMTRKHKKNDKMITMDDVFTPKNATVTKIYTCDCGKDYNYRQGLWKHKKHCLEAKSVKVLFEKEPQNELKMLTDLVLGVVKQNKELVTQNSELTNKIVDICKVGQACNSIKNSNINSNNKTFNLNVYLNETCKDAMNITDFVDSLKLQLSDLENVGRLGFVEGISNIIVKSLKEMDVHKRPVHCSDSKREVMYIKDEDKWEKENENKNKLRKVIKKVASKNQRLLPKFKEEHPDCGNYHSKYSDQYNKLIVESMGGSGDNDMEKEDKIIRKIAKEVVIDKSITYLD